MIEFAKMHGLGNDFVVIDCTDGRTYDFAGLAVAMCDRHFGIGADGLIAILPGLTADCRMRIFNADGSEAQMCGNGIRCVGKYVRDRGLVVSDCISVETLGGVKKLMLTYGGGADVESVTVDMGMPELRSDKMPDGMMALSVGNSHIVVFVDDVSGFPVDVRGPELERHPIWPEKANVEFVEVVALGELRQRTWERGVGETKACGTGACAAAVAAVRSGRATFPVKVHLLGGDLNIVAGPSGNLLMTGPAAMVFEGRISWPIPSGGKASGSL